MPCSAQDVKGRRSLLPGHSWVGLAEHVLGALRGFLGSAVGRDYKSEINNLCIKVPRTPPAQSRGNN